MQSGNRRGILISFEGIDGAGKSTLARRVSFALSSLGFPVLLTQEPAGTFIGRELDTLLKNNHGSIGPCAEYLTFAAARAEHFEKLVIPALTEGKIILSDRMGDSSIAYQGYGRGLDIAFIEMVNNFVMRGTIPNLTVYLSLDVETAQQRITSRSQQASGFDRERKDMILKIKQGFDAIMDKKETSLILDGRQELDELSSITVQKIIDCYHANPTSDPTRSPTTY